MSKKSTKNKINTDQYIHNFVLGLDVPKELGNYYIVSCPHCKILMHVTLCSIDLVGIRFDSLCLMQQNFFHNLHRELKKLTVSMHFPSYILTREKGCLTTAKVVEASPNKDRFLLEIVDRYIFAFKAEDKFLGVVLEKNEGINWLDDCNHNIRGRIFKPRDIEFPFLTKKEKLFLENPPKLENEDKFYNYRAEYIESLENYLQKVREIHRRFKLLTYFYSRDIEKLCNKDPGGVKSFNIEDGNKQKEFVDIDGQWHEIFITGNWE